MMISEIFSLIPQLGSVQLIFILAIMVIFIVFLVFMKKLVKTVINFVWIGLASAAFPFVMNFVFGIKLPISIESILSFIILGLGLYFIYILGKIIYTALGLAEKTAKLIAYPITARRQKKKEEREKKIDKLLEKEEKEEKKADKKKALHKKHEADKDENEDED